jgi:hypothetical protein
MSCGVWTEHQPVERVRRQNVYYVISPREHLLQRNLKAQSPFAEAINLPQFPQNGTMIHFHELKGFVEIRQAPNHLVKSEI